MTYSYGWVWWWLLWVPLFFLMLWWVSATWGQGSSAYRNYNRANQRLRRFGSARAFGFYRGRGPRDYRRSDEKITEEINDELTMNGDIDATDVLVQVHDGMVTLSGSVLSRGEKRVAEAIADDVPGVRDVKNELSVGKRLAA